MIDMSYFPVGHTIVHQRNRSTLHEYQNFIIFILKKHYFYYSLTPFLHNCVKKSKYLHTFDVYFKYGLNKKFGVLN